MHFEGVIAFDNTHKYTKVDHDCTTDVHKYNPDQNRIPLSSEYPIYKTRSKLGQGAVRIVPKNEEHLRYPILLRIRRKAIHGSAPRATGHNGAGDWSVLSME